jgi:hypothetical protein
VTTTPTTLAGLLAVAMFILVFALVGPHRKMNFSLSRPEANDVAEYIGTLADDW